MNSYVALFLVGLCIINSSLASPEEDRKQVFADRGYAPMKPSKTHDLLKSLSSAYNVDEKNIVLMDKDEINDLVTVAGVTEEKCNQEFVDRINNLLLKYANSQLNIVPHLQYNKAKLITDCDSKFNINLDPKVHLSGRQDILDGRDKSEGELEEEDPEVGASREVEEAKQRQEINERLDKIRKDKKERQDKIDNEWIKRYKAVFIEVTEYEAPEKMDELLVSLYKSQRATSESNNIKKYGEDIFNLLKLTYNFANSCNLNAFDEYYVLIQKYSDDFSNNILEFVKYQQYKLWAKCLQAFHNAQKEDEDGYRADQTEAFALVDHVFAHLPYPPVDPEWSLAGPESIETGIVSYAREKLGKKAHKQDRINTLFNSTIKPLCYNMKEKFRGIDGIGDIAEGKREFKEGLDKMSIKWLTSIAFCKITIANLEKLREKTLSTLQEQHQECKNNSCMGKLFGKNG